MTLYLTKAPDCKNIYLFFLCFIDFLLHIFFFTILKNYPSIQTMNYVIFICGFNCMQLCKFSLNLTLFFLLSVHTCIYSERENIE